MPALPLTTADYPAVRAAIDTELDATALPDNIIQMDIYQGAAEREVKQRDPDWATRTGDDEKRIKAAAVYLTAARICPAVVRITSLRAQTRDLWLTKPTFDPEEKAAQLRAWAEMELAAVLTPSDETPNRPTMFALAAGRRGR